jgi:hypothetical protein
MNDVAYSAYSPGLWSRKAGTSPVLPPLKNEGLSQSSKGSPLASTRRLKGRMYASMNWSAAAVLSLE